MIWALGDLCQGSPMFETFMPGIPVSPSLPCPGLMGRYGPVLGEPPNSFRQWSCLPRALRGAGSAQKRTFAFLIPSRPCPVPHPSIGMIVGQGWLGPCLPRPRGVSFPVTAPLPPGSHPLLASGGR
ncbi:hypothetical protein DSO57_1012031 [Entomophthora muscae]|uniref:Uncharacterized protein n=1 Tax=Entomophthora muscae TaxID=34485 RepID=A0ACC2RKS3_9FUNG|nr:hypothetical protein DSO57_1012031 [Entomophthora muscae]